MFWRRTDLPVDSDSLGRFLPGIVAFMVYLATLALAGVMILMEATTTWQAGLSSTMTVQIAPEADTGGGLPAAEDSRVQSALALLRRLPDVARADVVNDEAMTTLLEPWLGEFTAVEELPLPRLIDVELRNGAEIDALGLAELLTAEVPEATVDDHRVWLDRLARLARAVGGLAVIVLVVIGAITVTIVIFTTRTTLAIHRNAIEVLHLIGAHDAYVADQFARRALVLALKGGLVGLALAVSSLVGLAYLAARIESELVPDIAFGPLRWAAILVLPLVVAAIATLTARGTVMRALAKML